MSNTSTVTPYAAATAVATTRAMQSASSGLARAVAWLTEEAPGEAEARRRIRDKRRREFVSSSGCESDLRGPERCVAPPEFVGLQNGDLVSIRRSAEALGYRAVDRGVQVSGEASLLMMENPLSGVKVVFRRDATDSSGITAVGERSRIQEVVFRHSKDRAVEHLRSRGMELQTVTLASGELQILARESGPRKRGGNAQIRAQVRSDGVVDVDIACIRGDRCEEIVGDLARAVGGGVTASTRKSEYFQLPGEPASVGRKVRI